MARQKKTHINLEDYLPSVRYWARHYSQKSNQVVDFDDLIIVGMMGLMDAVKKFNPKRDVLFKTYAEFRIRGEIIDELRKQDWMSRSERRKQKLYRKTQEKLEQNLGRSPTCTELAKVLPFKPREIDRMRQYEAKDTLKTYQESDLPVDANKDVVAEEIFSRHQLHDLLELLPELHRKVLELRYLDDAPLSFISKEIQLSEGRVSQLHTEAIEMLREHISLSDLAA